METASSQENKKIPEQDMNSPFVSLNEPAPSLQNNSHGI